MQGDEESCQCVYNDHKEGREGGLVGAGEESAVVDSEFARMGPLAIGFRCRLLHL